MSEVVDLTPELLEAFLQGPIRQQDVDEWVFLGAGNKVATTLRKWAPSSTVARAFLDDHGQPVCLWGLASGYLCWLIAAKSAYRYGKAIHRLWPEELRHFEASATGHLLAINIGTGDEKWHKALGFEVMHREQTGDHVHYTTYIRRLPWAL